MMTYHKDEGIANHESETVASTRRHHSTRRSPQQTGNSSSSHPADMNLPSGLVREHLSKEIKQDPSIFILPSSSANNQEVKDRRNWSASSIVSRWSRPNLVKSIFYFDAAAIEEQAVHRLYRHDDPWQAARRGDLGALKGFQIRGEVNWKAKDKFGNTPLFYACNSGVAENVMVVPFLLWATDFGEEKSTVIRKLRETCSNKQAKAILRVFERGGLAAVSKGSRKKEEDSKTLKQQNKRGSGAASIHLSQTSPIEVVKKSYQNSTWKADIGSHASKSLSSIRTPVMEQRLSPLEQNESLSGMFEVDLSGGMNVKEIDNVSSMSLSDGVLDPLIDADERSIVQRLVDIQKPASSGRLQTVKQSDKTNRRNPFHPAMRDVYHTPYSAPISLKEDNGMPSKFRREKLLRDTRDEIDSTEIDDWDTPVEQEHSIGQQYLSGHIAETSGGSDKDSWSFGSMLSPRKPKKRNGRSMNQKIAMILESDILTGKDEKSSSGLPRKQCARFDQHPFIDYDEKEKIWTIGRHMKMGQDKMLHVQDSRQRVRVLDCNGINLHIHGRKMKAILIENCVNVNVIFDSVITTCDITGCQNVGLQVTGLCPTLSFNNTDRVTVWLTREGMKVSNFVTNKSSNILISVPTQDDLHPWDRKEVLLPAQYVHKFHEKGGIVSHLPGQAY